MAAEISNSPLFAVQIDESTDVSSCSQLLVFSRYIESGDIKEEFLFCEELKTTTTSHNIINIVKKYFKENKLQWEKLCV